MTRILESGHRPALGLAQWMIGPPLGSSPDGLDGRQGAFVSVAPDAMAGVTSWWASSWPIVVTAVAVLVAAMVVSVLFWRTRYAVAGRAEWLEITPPATYPADAAVALWRVLAGFLDRAPRRPWKPAPALAAEFHADPAGVRAGVWVAPPLRAEHMAAAIRRVLPGAQIRHTTPPVWYAPPSVLQLRPAGGRWAPLIDPAHRPSHASRDQPGDEPLRAVLDALADRQPGQQAAVQLVITPTGGPLPGLVAGLDRVDPAELCRNVTTFLLAGTAELLSFLVSELLDLFTGSSGSTNRRGSTGTVAGASRPATATGTRTGLMGKAADAKRTAGAHLHATLRVAVTTHPTNTSPALPGPRARRARLRLARDIAAGYDLVTTHATLHTRPARNAERLWCRAPGAGFNATLAELAALWHLPAQPHTYGLPAPSARNRAPARQLPRLPLPRTARRTGSSRPTNTGNSNDAPAPGDRRPGPDGGPTPPPSPPGRGAGSQPGFNQPTRPGRPIRATAPRPSSTSAPLANRDTSSPAPRAGRYRRYGGEPR
ncbi:hypothetical protein GCM10023321_63800 [Pseudonocardia eucalypti]|uniref:Type VII secretion protein EccE n=1 Tax=Pseudonocardia eucalypti TaxID=648755 RepID=A0ABP9QWY4_9PSEU|nr:hypothetical protein [Pseudonocardia eucalypti]